MLTLLLWLQQMDPPGVGPTWEVTKGILLFVSTSLLGYLAVAARQLLKGQQRHEAILIGVDGKNGLRSKVDLLVTRVDAIEDRNIAIDAIVEAERQQWPYPDRRAGPRRMKDVVREVQEERTRRITDEHSIEDPDR